jgi:hypothetical protein
LKENRVVKAKEIRQINRDQNDKHINDQDFFEERLKKEEEKTEERKRRRIRREREYGSL